MNDLIPCPPDEKLAQFVARTLGTEGMKRLEEHVAACPSCYHLVAAYARVYCGNALPAPAAIAEAANSTGSFPGKVERLGLSGGLPMGTVVGRYVVASWIGEGGAGVVYSAYDPELDRKVALKLIRQPESVHGQDRVREALSREARAMAKLAHPNVAAIYDIGAFEGRVFIAMEFVEGVTLRRWLDDAKPDRRRILEMFLGCGRGLEAAHQAGLVHRDFKPENVLVGADGRARVTDFGLARLMRERGAEDAAGSDAPKAHAARPVEGSATAGTPAYMAPEQKLGQPDARSDQFSFCLALYEALCGERPASHEPPGSEHAHHDLPAFAALPLRIKKALSRGLRNAPGDRYATMSHLLAELDHELRGRSRRAWTWAFAAVVSVAGVSFGVSQRVAHARTQVCTAAQDRLAGVWDPPRKDAVARAIRATGKPFAEDAWRGVERTLDDYARAWATERTDACEATRVRGEQSEAVLDRRMQCLDRRLLDLRELSEVLSRADGPVVQSAVQATQQIAPLTACSALRVGASPAPSDPAISQLLARAEALRATRQFDQAAAVGHSALDAARAGKLGELEAEALNELAQNALDHRDGPGAEPFAFDAIEAAERAGSDEWLARSALVAAMVVGDMRDRTSEAKRWMALASGAIDRIGGDDRLESLLATTRASIFSHEGKYSEAQAQARIAVRIAEERLPNQLLAQSSAYNALGRALEPTGKTAEAEAAFRKTLELDLAALGPDHPRVAVTLANLAITADYECRYEEARGLVERALSIREKLGPGDPMIPALLSDLGSETINLGRYDEARATLERALVLSQSETGVEARMVAGIHMRLGDLDRRSGRYAEALSELRIALDIHDHSLGPDNPQTSGPHLLLGRVYLDEGKPEAALPEIEKALALLSDAGPLDLAEAQFVLARALWQAGRDHPRALQLVAHAREAYRGHPARAAEVDDIEQWFAQHAPSLHRAGGEHS